MESKNLLICPICKKTLFPAGNSLKCESNHSYDFAKSGYINLLNPGKKNNAKAGDSKEMISARTTFFASCAYKPIQDKLCALVGALRPALAVDAGCGEGYYTEAIAKSNPSATVIGFDMSKFGCEHGAKSAKSNGITNTFYSVSNIFDMPLENSCADVIVNMFAPVADEEFYRILKNGGYLIIGASGKEHLIGLKRAIYDTAYLNEPNEHSYKGFELVGCENLKYDASICGKDIIFSLFQMTPYFHRTSLADKEKLLSLDSLETTVEVDFFILKKQMPSD